MPLPTQPLRDEHKDLFPHVETLKAAADAVGTATPADLRVRVDKTHDFLTHHLIPHACPDNNEALTAGSIKP